VRSNEKTGKERNKKKKKRKKSMSRYRSVYAQRRVHHQTTRAQLFNVLVIILQLPLK